MYHPSIYKTQWCNHRDLEQCPKGKYCAFAHNESEMREPSRSPIIDYKVLLPVQRDKIYDFVDSEDQLKMQAMQSQLGNQKYSTDSDPQQYQDVLFFPLFPFLHFILI